MQYDELDRKYSALEDEATDLRHTLTESKSLFVSQKMELQNQLAILKVRE